MPSQQLSGSFSGHIFYAKSVRTLSGELLGQLQHVGLAMPVRSDTPMRAVDHGAGSWTRLKQSQMEAADLTQSRFEHWDSLHWGGTFGLGSCQCVTVVRKL